MICHVTRGKLQPRRLPRAKDKLQRASSVPDVDHAVTLTLSGGTRLGWVRIRPSKFSSDSLQICGSDQAHLRDVSLLVTAWLWCKLMVLLKWISNGDQDVQKISASNFRK